jgi:hypothetical protein
MEFIRKHIAFRYFWVFMALHILNCSIDAPDKLPDYIPENLSFNDIESISELILEQFMGFENAVEEHEEPDSTDGLSFEVAKIILFYQPSFVFSVPLKVKDFSEESSFCRYQDIHFTLFHPEIVSPPPQSI